MSLDPSLLVLIDDEVAYRLIATWPSAGRQVRTDEVIEGARLIRRWGATDGAGNSNADKVAGGLGRWSEISGVDVEVVAHWVPVLFDNGILGPEGTVDDQARDLVRIAGTRRLRGGGTR